jgi:hypothetical protein
MRDALMSVSFGPDRHDCGPMTVEFGSAACSMSFGSESSPAKLTAEFAGSANVKHRFGVRRS